MQRTALDLIDCLLTGVDAIIDHLAADFGRRKSMAMQWLSRELAACSQPLNLSSTSDDAAGQRFAKLQQALLQKCASLATSFSPGNH